MEHLGKANPFRIGKVGHFVRHQYDFKGFHSFPSRQGWRLAPDGRWHHKDNELDSQIAQTSKLSGFLQAWLFFGLLCEVLNLHGPSELDQFLGRSDLDKSFITTATLEELVEKWVSNITRNSARRIELIKAQLALDRAYELVSKYCSVKTCLEQPSWQINPMVALSLLVLGETLDHAVATASRIMNINVNGWHVAPERGWGYSQVVFAKMMHDKWCKNSLSILQGVLQNSTIGMMYAMRLSHPTSLGLDHNLCDSFVCKARDQAFRSRGSHEDGSNCHCALLGPDLEVVSQFLLQDESVLLHYDLATSSFRVVPYKRHMRYAIFSHVWADGFGNEVSNTLPKCWLDKFSKLLKLASEYNRVPCNEQESSPDEVLYFWIDTLMVPVGENFRGVRRIALQGMHQMYVSAACTIVLDAGLMSESMVDVAEAAMRITTSQWITRLWTLQEAYLSKKVFFCFADEQLVEMDILESRRTYDNISPLSTSAHAYHKAILGPERKELLQLRATSHKLVTRRLDLEFMVSLWNAMQWRTVTRPEDETLAMAILLGLDTKPFDDCSLVDGPEINQETKMATLLSMVNEISAGCIPEQLLFLPGRKLSQRGFGWAPLTWLRQSGMSPQIISRQQGGSRLAANGLLVQSPGLEIHCEDGRTVADAKSILIPMNNSLTSWLSIKHIEDGIETMTSKSPDIAIVLPPDTHARKEATGLLVEITRRESDTRHGRILKRVQVRVEENIASIEHARLTLLDQPYAGAYGELLHRDQYWCLDGPELDRQHPSNRDPLPHPLMRVLSAAFPRSFSWT